MDLASDVRRARLLFLSLGATGVGLAGAGFWQYAHGGNVVGNRITAHLSIYMTYSGLVLLSGCLLLAFAFEERGRRRWIGLAAAAPLGAMLLTFTRNAYVGLFAALVVYLALRRPRGLLLLAPALLFVFWLLPEPIRERVRSIGNLQDESNRDRVAMMHAGARMIGDFPLFGLGPEMVKRYYPLYRDPNAPRWRVPHLHNNAVQFAAASGLPAAAAYLMLALGILVHTARRLSRERRPEVAVLLAGALLASTGLFAAGLFEYNFGDTEIEMATLIVWGIPFSAATAPREAPASD
jgi:O-antigen ligase